MTTIAAPHRTARLACVAGYRSLRLLGAGRMATVCLAQQRSSGRQVALKVLKPAFEDDGAGRRSLAAECAALASIRHEQVVRMLDHRLLGDPGYLAMEYLDGGTLRDRLGSPLRPAQAVSLLRQAAGALAAVHRRAMVHRDVKPENFLLRSCGVLVLTDFGLAAPQGFALPPPSPGRLVGTPRYVSPEQAEGEPPAAAADVYSLGVLFHEMLCGRPPFAGRTALEVVAQHLVAPVPRLPRALALWQPLIDAMLDKHSQRRPADADAVLREIRRLAPLPADRTQ